MSDNTKWPKLAVFKLHDKMDFGKISLLTLIKILLLIKSTFLSAHIKNKLISYISKSLRPSMAPIKYLIKSKMTLLHVIKAQITNTNKFQSLHDFYC